MRTGKQRIRGFTIIEVVTVLMLIAIISVIVVSRSTSATTYALLSQIEVLKTDLRFAQTRAIHSGTRWGVKFGGSRSFDGRAYSNYWLFKGTAFDAPVAFPSKGDGRYTVVFGDDHTLGLWPLAVTTEGVVIFDRRGRPVDSAGNPLAADMVITIANGDDIIITKNTGYID